jgi:hypothetical protein
MNCLELTVSGEVQLKVVLANGFVLKVNVFAFLYSLIVIFGVCDTQISPWLC